MSKKASQPMNDESYGGLRRALLHIELCLTITERMIKDPDNRDIRDRLRGELAGYTAAQKATLRTVKAEQERRAATSMALASTESGDTAHKGSPSHCTDDVTVQAEIDGQGEAA